MRVAFVPSAPRVLLGHLREECAPALAVLGDDVVVVGAHDVDGWVEGVVDAGPWTTGTRHPDALPLALAVGAHLLGRPARLWGTTGQPPPPGADLLVVADGTAKRTEKAPGHYDPRAEDFDRQVQNALAAGDPAALLALAPTLADDLWVQGVPAWRAAAQVATGPWRATVHWADAPHGVGYVVASWVPLQE